MEFAKALYESLLAVQDDFYQRNIDDQRRTVVIDDLGLRATDFGITTVQKKALIAQGASATRSYLAAYTAAGRARSLTVSNETERSPSMAVLTPPNPLTLIMPLKPGAQQEVGGLLAKQQGGIDDALGVVGTVHYARFVLLDASSPNLQPLANSTGPFLLAVITTYDGDFDIYIQDFVAQLGDVFDALLELTTDGSQLVPVKDNVTQFIAWIKANDLSQQEPNEALSQYAAYPYTVQAILAEFGS